MAHQWYCIRGGKQCGPVSTVEIKQLADTGQLARDDMVWKEGLPNWISADEVNGLFAKGQAIPPPPPTTKPPLTTRAVSAAPAKDGTLNCPRFGDKNVYALSIVWGEGTTSTVGRNIGVGGLAGGLIGHFPPLAALGAGATASSKSQFTMLAKECAPPKQKSVGWPIAGMVFGALLLLGGIMMAVELHAGRTIDPDANPGRVFMGVILGPLMMWFGYRFYCLAQNFNKVQFSKIFSDWQSSFICLRCGDRFKL